MRPYKASDILKIKKTPSDSIDSNQLEGVMPLSVRGKYWAFSDTKVATGKKGAGAGFRPGTGIDY
jgi:hypothetical protein